MDNVTHSLAGLVLAEAATRIRARRSGVDPSPRFRSVAAVSSLLAANLPDADLFYTGAGFNRLAYMLHHRGYTHTVVMALVGAVVLWGAALLVWRWRQRAPAPSADARWLLGLLVVSALSHLLLDWTNSYGVHPFWPVDDRWRYGDAVFIIEPWLWVVSVPALVAASGRLVPRALLSLVLAAGLVLAWRVDLVSTGAAAALTAGAVVSIAIARALGARSRIAAAVGGWAIVTLLMTAGAAQARAATIRALHTAAPGDEVLDVVVSPLPANAVCMQVIAVERAGGTYRVSHARVSAVPALARANECGSRSGSGPLYHPSLRQSTAAVQWDGEWTAPAAELAALARESCTVLAALRFIRVPVWHPDGATTVVLGDARYGGGAGDSFTDVRAPRRSATCPSNVPPWTPPRADLLRR